jgi:hypothetical protein
MATTGLDAMLHDSLTNLPPLTFTPCEPPTPAEILAADERRERLDRELLEAYTAATTAREPEQRLQQLRRMRQVVSDIIDGFQQGRPDDLSQLDEELAIVLTYLRYRRLVS